MGFAALEEFRRLDDYFERWFLRISFAGAPTRRQEGNQDGHANGVNLFN